MLMILQAVAGEAEWRNRGNCTNKGRFALIRMSPSRVCNVKGAFYSVWLFPAPRAGRSVLSTATVSCAHALTSRTRQLLIHSLSTCSPNAHCVPDTALGAAGTAVRNRTTGRNPCLMGLTLRVGMETASTGRYVSYVVSQTCCRENEAGKKS